MAIMYKQATFRTNYQFRFWRTRRMASLGFFRTSIHSMTDVARDKPYL